MDRTADAEAKPKAREGGKREASMKTTKTTKTTAVGNAPAATGSEAPVQSSSAVSVKIPADLILDTERRAYAGAFRRGLAGTHLAYVHLPLMPVLARGWLEGDRQRTEARIAGEVIADMLTAELPDAADVAEHEAARA
jgi:hypothetical protein